MANSGFDSALQQALSRRNFLAIAGGGAAAGLLGACSSGSGSGAGARMTLSSWNIPADLTSYKKIAADYAQAHPGTNIDVQVTVADNFDAWLSARLAANNAPDILRLQYQDVGKYAKLGGLVDLREYFPKNYGDDFLAPYWGTVDIAGGLYGVPHQTDGWGIYLDNEIMAKVGADVPTKLEDAWGWDEFLTLAREVKKATGKYAFSFFFAPPVAGWRWLPFLYMHGGALLTPDLKSPAIDSPEGVEAIAYAQTWFKEGLIPPSNSVKGSQGNTAETLFIQHQVGMMISSDFKTTALRGKLPDERWTTTYLPKDEKVTTNLGGNALVVTKSAKAPAEAAKFAETVCNPKNMKYFCEQGQLVPVRKEFIGKQLEWVYRPDLMKRFSEQAATLLPEMAQLQALPEFGSINQILTDQLDLCWTGQQSPSETAKKIADGIKSRLAT